MNHNFFTDFLRIKSRSKNNRFVLEEKTIKRVCLLVLLLLITLPIMAYPYKVQHGDTLYSLSIKFNIPITAIRSNNNIKGNFIREGAMIQIPSGNISYKVVKGDNLYRLALRSGSTVDELLALNGLPVNFVLKTGTTILLKSGSSTPKSQTILITQSNPVNQNSRESQNKKAPLNILLIGDSLAYGTRNTFSKSLSSPQYNFESKGVSSSGLVTNNFFDWIAEADSLANKGKWDSVIMMIGANDGQAFSRNGVVIPLFSNEWYRIYKERAKKVIRTFTEKGSDFYWLSVPPMARIDYNGRMIKLNSLIKEICIEENIEFVDLGAVIGNSNGNYSDTKIINGQWQKVRIDGIHYSLAGSRLVTNKILNIIEENK